MKVGCFTGVEGLRELELEIELGDNVLPENGITPIPDVPGCPGCRFDKGKTEKKFVQIKTERNRGPSIFKCWLNEK